MYLLPKTRETVLFIFCLNWYSKNRDVEEKVEVPRSSKWFSLLLFLSFFFSIFNVRLLLPVYDFTSSLVFSK